MIQTEVAERIIAEPPKMNRLAASVQFWADVNIIARVPRADFSPPPEVDSAVIKLDAKPSSRENVKLASRYYAAVRAIFAQPRKTILNNVSAAGEEKKKVSAALMSMGIIPESRPQNLTIENISTIAKKFFT